MQSSENSSDPTLQLSHTIYNPYVEEGLSPYGEEVVVTVSATTQDLGAPAASTELIVSSAGDNRARGLEIRGNNIEYVFDTIATAGANGQ
jgi:hypothetical protein